MHYRTRVMNFPIIQYHDELIQAVDAKELYQKLGLNPTQWGRWSKQNIANNPFALEGTDYGVYDSMSNTQGGRPTTNYALSIDFAKKLSMQVQTEKGEEIRDYFLECERQAQQPSFNLPQTFSEALQLAADQAKQLELAAPKINAYDKLIESTHLKSVGDVAKSIGLKSAQALNKKLEAVKAYDGRCSNRVWSGWFVEQGLGEMRTTDDGYSRNLIAAKGQAWALELFSN